MLQLFPRCFLFYDKCHNVYDVNINLHSAAIKPREVLLFFKIRLPTGDRCCNMKWTRYTATVRQSLFVWSSRESFGGYAVCTFISSVPFPPSRRFHYRRGSQGIARATSLDATQSLTRRCTRKPLKAVRFCWRTIEAHRYVKMSRQFLMKPRSA